MVNIFQFLIYLSQFFTLHTLLEEVLSVEINNEKLNTEVNILGQQHENI